MSLWGRLGEKFSRREDKRDTGLPIFSEPQTLAEAAPAPSTEAATPVELVTSPSNPRSPFSSNATAEEAAVEAEEMLRAKREYRVRNFPERAVAPEPKPVSGLENARGKGRVFFRAALNRINN